MEMSAIERLLAETEAKVRVLLERTCLDDSYCTQVELRETMASLQALRAELALAAVPVAAAQAPLH